MLPFLKKKPQVGVIVTSRPADEPKQAEDPIEYCAQDLIDAVHANDKKAAVQAIRDMFDIMESEPHREGPHTKEE